MFDITQILLGVLSLCTMLITSFILPRLKTQLGIVKYSEAVDKLGVLLTYARVVVEAVEQQFYGTTGSDKLAHAMTTLTAMLESRNLTFSSEEMRTAIEKSVLDLHEAATSSTTTE